MPGVCPGGGGGGGCASFELIGTLYSSFVFWLSVEVRHKPPKNDGFRRKKKRQQKNADGIQND